MWVNKKKWQQVELDLSELHGKMDTLLDMTTRNARIVATEVRPAVETVRDAITNGPISQGSVQS